MVAKKKTRANDGATGDTNLGDYVELGTSEVLEALASAKAAKAAAAAPSVIVINDSSISGGQTNTQVIDVEEFELPRVALDGRENVPEVETPPKQRLPRTPSAVGLTESTELVMLLSPPGKKRQRATERCHYETLGIARTATLQEIRRAYKTCALRCHPDKGGDTSSMQAVKEAFECLSDPLLRFEYDESLEEHDLTPSRDGMPPDEAGVDVEAATTNEAVAAETEAVRWRKGCVCARQMMEDWRVGEAVELCAATVDQCVCLRQMLIDGPDCILAKHEPARPAEAECPPTVSSFKGKIAITRRMGQNNYELCTNSRGMEIYTQKVSSLEVALDYQIALGVFRVALDHHDPVEASHEPFHAAIQETFAMAPSIRLYFRSRCGPVWGPTTLNWKLGLAHNIKFREVAAAVAAEPPTGRATGRGKSSQKKGLGRGRGKGRGAAKAKKRAKADPPHVIWKQLAVEEVDEEKQAWAMRRQALLEAVDAEMPKRAWASELRADDMARRTAALKQQLVVANKTIAEARVKAHSDLASDHLRCALKLDPPAAVSAAIKLRRLPDSVLATRVQSLLAPMEQAALPAPKGNSSTSRASTAPPRPKAPRTPRPGPPAVPPPFPEVPWLRGWPLDTSRLPLLCLDCVQLCYVQATSRALKIHCEQLLWHRCRSFEFFCDAPKVTRSSRGRLLKPHNSKTVVAYSQWLTILKRASLSAAFETLDLRAAPGTLFDDKDFRQTLRRLKFLETVTLPQTRWRSWGARSSFVQSLPDHVKPKFVS
eukprot:TRINITY_DN22064_c0_g1_i1.p1 TRINITY_DN22064_c0_g1~~TRINITY_DN22064_c0_g1_i1.p1  ORF type:complete len:769 (-),score=156.99 TRINITY_DN22064_c0_g1_i1:161-2467(-)